MVTFSLTQYMVVLILLISAFLLIISFKVIRNAKRKSSSQIRRSNGLFLFSLTGIVICGIVILGENKPQNKEKVNIGDFIVEVHKTPEKINREAIDDKAKSNYYIQEKLQFILLRPSTGSFSSPIKTSYLEHFIKEMLFETRDNNLSAFLRFRSNKAMLNCVFKSYELNKTEDIASCAINMNKSGLFNHLLQFSYSIQFNSKQKTIIELTDKSSLPFENLFQSDSTITAQNDSLKKGFPDIKSFNFQPYLNVIVFDKKNNKGEDQKINAANFLLMGANSFFQNIEKIVSNENHILLCGNLSFKNVKVNGELNNLVINRWFRIIDTEQKLYVLEMAHSPQQDKENKSWPELKKAFESFKLISN